MGYDVTVMRSKSVKAVCRSQCSAAMLSVARTRTTTTSTTTTVVAATTTTTKRPFFHTVQRQYNPDLFSCGVWRRALGFWLTALQLVMLLTQSGAAQNWADEDLDDRKMLQHLTDAVETNKDPYDHLLDQIRDAGEFDDVDGSLYYLFTTIIGALLLSQFCPSVCSFVCLFFMLVIHA